MKTAEEIVGAILGQYNASVWLGRTDATRALGYILNWIAERRICGEELPTPTVQDIIAQPSQTP